MLVDDTPENLEHCIDLLRADYEVVGTSANGKEAVRVIAETAPDVVVLEVSTPEINGIEVANRLRDLGCEAVIVFLSANEDDVWAALDAGASAYLSKAFVSDLPIVIAQALAGRVYVSLSTETCQSE
jgi:CheY-like chemotaxis protein